MGLTRKFTRTELKRSRSKISEEKIADGMVQTALLHGTDAYQRACGHELSAHGVAIASVWGADDANLVVPLRLAFPIAEVVGRTLEDALRDHGQKPAPDVLDGGLLIIGSTQVAIGWQQPRAGLSGKMGMYDACASVLSYEEIGESRGESVSVSFLTPEQGWDLTLKMKAPPQEIYRDRGAVLSEILMSLRSGSDQ